MIHRTIYMYWLSGFIGVHDFEHVNRFQNPIPFPPSVCLILCCVMCKVNCFTKSSWPLSLCFMVNFKWCDLIFRIANIQDNCIQSFASHSQQNQCILLHVCTVSDIHKMMHAFKVCIGKNLLRQTTLYLYYVCMFP